MTLHSEITPEHLQILANYFHGKKCALNSRCRVVYDLLEKLYSHTKYKCIQIKSEVPSKRLSINHSLLCGDIKRCSVESKKMLTRKWLFEPLCAKIGNNDFSFKSFLTSYALLTTPLYSTMVCCARISDWNLEIVQCYHGHSMLKYISCINSWKKNVSLWFVVMSFAYSSLKLAWLYWLMQVLGQ